MAGITPAACLFFHKKTQTISIHVGRIAPAYDFALRKNVGCYSPAVICQCHFLYLLLTTCDLIIFFLLSLVNFPKVAHDIFKRIFCFDEPVNSG